ncbi:hypothetical protein B0T20DRAFT_392124 [Sordaria brevicollis]|uniref:Uncharacterized protein n=1 Tax=Sordaria brevicollis TaxID=83679 RepID=A0AAE0PFP4_SORBR|nr:hypothetical protein B0T20DRAFT_392124 [Sordaria brevicollis]
MRRPSSRRESDTDSDLNISEDNGNNNNDNNDKEEDKEYIFNINNRNPPLYIPAIFILKWEKFEDWRIIFSKYFNEEEKLPIGIRLKIYFRPIFDFNTVMKGFIKEVKEKWDKYAAVIITRIAAAYLILILRR